MATELIKITDTELQRSAVQYQKELVSLPVLSARNTLQHLTPMPGLHGRVVLSELGGGAELGPYDPDRVDSDQLPLSKREIEVFLGSMVKKFDPNQLRDTVFGQVLSQGEGLKDVDFARQILAYLGAQLGRSLEGCIFSAKRNANGTKTADLFNGFDTLTAEAVTDGTIAADLGNLHVLSAAADKTNAVDLLKEFYWSASDDLQMQDTKLFMPVALYNLYNEAYKLETGLVPYNTEYKKTYLEGSNNRCELVPVVSKKGATYIQLTPRQNMVYAYGNGLAEEQVIIEKHHEFYLSYIATMFFGTQFRSVSKEALHVGQLA